MKLVNFDQHDVILRTLCTWETLLSFGGAGDIHEIDGFEHPRLSMNFGNFAMLAHIARL